jgi:hypothetical protein
MTDVNIDTPDITLSQQLGAINTSINNQLLLSLNLKSSSDDKMKSIFEVLSRPTLTENHKDVLMSLIDACKHKKYTYTRIGSFSRKVVKTSLT